MVEKTSVLNYIKIPFDEFDFSEPVATFTDGWSQTAVIAHFNDAHALFKDGEAVTYAFHVSLRDYIRDVHPNYYAKHNCDVRSALVELVKEGFVAEFGVIQLCEVTGTYLDCDVFYENIG